MTAEQITAATTQFTDAIGSVSTPIITIMGAGIAIAVIFVLFKVGKKALNKSTS